MKLKNITVQVGGFHDHWLRNGTDTASVLIAAVTKYHYDFICLMDNDFGERAKDIKNQIESWIPDFKVHLGTERMYGWGHVVSVMNEEAHIDLQNTNFKNELKKSKEASGIVALAHISYPASKEKILELNELDSLIDEDFVDAIQIQVDSDWEYIKERAKAGKKLPLISGWDSHMLKEEKDMPDWLYNESFGVKEHFDHASMMRTIVFAEDNSLEAIKKALNEGKSVVEDTLTDKLYGTPELIDLLLSNGYRERMSELDKEYSSLNIDEKAFFANSSKTVQLPACGTVKYPVSSELEYKVISTDSKGNVEIPGMPMPAQQDTSYVPIYWTDGKRSRYWAVKIENDIQLDVIPKIKDGKRVLCIISRKPFSGKLIFESPSNCEFSVSSDESGILFNLPVENTVPQVFEYSFKAVNASGSERIYSAPAAVTVAHKFNGSWDSTEGVKLDKAQYCGGFGSFRPYPGKDVFSSEIKFMWDEEALYVKYDITDKIYVSPPSGIEMYMSDSTTLNIDPYLIRSKSRNSGCELLLGFPADNEAEGLIFCSHVPCDNEGKAYYGRHDRIKLNGELNMEFTEKGRVVTAKIPWKEISPMQPQVGTHIGINAGCLNDEGDGLVDNMQWPWAPKAGEWLFPCNWGVLALVE